MKRAGHQLNKHSRRLLYKLYPEMEVFERNHLGRFAAEGLTMAKHEVMRTWRFWLALSAVIGLFVALALLTRRLIMLRAWPGWLEQVFYWGLILAPNTGFAWWMFRNRVRRHLRARLGQLGVPICACGYDLRGQTAARCPECGRPFDDKLLTDVAEADES